MWRKRPTPTSRATSHSTFVPWQFVETKAYGSLIERSTCDSAAKCTTASCPARWRDDVVLIADVGVHETAPPVVDEVGDVRTVPGVREGVVDRHGVVRVGEHVAHVVRPDEPRRAGDEQLHGPIRRRFGSGRRPSGAAPAAGAGTVLTIASRPISESSRRGMSTTSELSMTTECSISLCSMRHPDPIAENGPMKLSTIRVPRPMATGPLIVELTISAPASRTTRPSSVDGVVDGAVDAVLDLLEQQAVGLEQRGQLPRVDPPPGQQLGAHPVAVVDQPLDGVGDLELAARRRLDRSRPPRGSWGRTGRRRRAPGPTAGRQASRPGARRGLASSSVAIPKRWGSGTCLSRIWAAGGSSVSRARSKASTKAARSCSSRLSPRYITKSS